MRPYWLRDLVLNNRWAARRRWNKLPQPLRDKLTLAMMEPREAFETDPRWPGIRFAPGLLGDLERMRCGLPPEQ